MGTIQSDNNKKLIDNVNLIRTRKQPIKRPAVFLLSLSSVIKLFQTTDHQQKLVSPLNPAPEHTYESILKGAVHLFTMWLIEDINPSTPKWIRLGIGGIRSQTDDARLY